MTLPKITLFLALASFFIFSACSENSDCEESIMEFTWSNNRSIAIDSAVTSFMVGDSIINLIEYRPIEGQDILFEFNNVSNLCDADIADGTSSMKFTMAIPSDSTSTFSYTDREILETSAYLNIFAAPSGLPHQFIEEGEIMGSRIDENSWRVSVDVVTSLQEYAELQGDQPQVISIDTTFVLR